MPDADLLFRLNQKKQLFREEYLRKAFADADTDNSGYIDPEEFQQLCWKLHGSITPEEVAEQLQRIDVNSDGQIDFEEFKEWWNSEAMIVLRQEKDAAAGIQTRWDESDLEERMKVKRRELDDQRLRRQFERVDEDGSGEIEFPEFRRLCRTMAPALSDDEIQVTFDEIDADGSGALDFVEFKAWWNTDSARELRGEQQAYEAARRALRERDAARMGEAARAKRQAEEAAKQREEAATTLQAAMRGRRDRVEQQQVIAATATIQAAMRGRQGRATALQKRSDAKTRRARETQEYWEQQIALGSLSRYSSTLAPVMGCRGGSPLLEIEAMRRNALAKARRAEARALAASPEKMRREQSGHDQLVAAAVAAVAQSASLGGLISDELGSTNASMVRMVGPAMAGAENAALAEACLTDPTKSADQSLSEAHAAINGLASSGDATAHTADSSSSSSSTSGSSPAMAVAMKAEAQLRSEYRNLAAAAPGTVERMGGYHGWKARTLAMRPELAHASALEVARARRDEAHWGACAAQQATAGQRFGRLTRIMEAGLATATAVAAQTAAAEASSPAYYIGQAAQRYRPPRPVSAGAEWGRERGAASFERTVEASRDARDAALAAATVGRTAASAHSPRAAKALQRERAKAGMMGGGSYPSSPPPPASATVLTDTALHGKHLRCLELTSSTPPRQSQKQEVVGAHSSAATESIGREAGESERRTGADGATAAMWQAEAKSLSMGSSGQSGVAGSTPHATTLAGASVGATASAAVASTRVWQQPARRARTQMHTAAGAASLRAVSSPPKHRSSPGSFQLRLPQTGEVALVHDVSSSSRVQAFSNGKLGTTALLSSSAGEAVGTEASILSGGWEQQLPADTVNPTLPVFESVSEISLYGGSMLDGGGSGGIAANATLSESRLAREWQLDNLLQRPRGASSTAAAVGAGRHSRHDSPTTVGLYRLGPRSGWAGSAAQRHAWLRALPRCATPVGSRPLTADHARRLSRRLSQLPSEVFEAGAQQQPGGGKRKKKKSVSLIVLEQTGDRLDPKLDLNRGKRASAMTA